MSEEWCSEKLQGLRIKENRLNALTEIRNEIVVSPMANITNRLLNAPEIYECLEEHNSSSGSGDGNEQFNVASDILSICMGNLSLGQADIPDLLQRALTHKRASIRALALNTMLKELQQKPEVETERFVLSDELLMHVLDGFQHEATEVGAPSASILALVLEDRLEQPQVKDALIRALNRDATIKCRVYELTVTLAKRSAALLEQVEFLLERALAELSIDDNDILLQVNVLEIMVSLAEQNHGLLYLEKLQFFESLSKRIIQLEVKPMDRLLVPGIMKFFGKIAYLQPQKIITGYPHMINCLFDCLRERDASLLPTALDTLANLTQTQQSKILMDTYFSNAIKETFQDFPALLSNVSTELKSRVFNTLEVVFETNGPVRPEVSIILNDWFKSLSPNNNMQFLMEYCRNPFPDIKISCLSFIRAVCQLHWGMVAAKDTAGFVEYLLDRKVEFDAEAKHVKFLIIRLLADSNVFDIQTHLQLNAYINEGPYFVETAMEVAYEGN